LLEDLREPEPMNKVQQVLWLTIRVQGGLLQSTDPHLTKLS